MRNHDPFPKRGKRGSIDLSKDYSKFSSGSRSKILLASLTMLPYLGLGVLLFLEGLKVLAIVLLLIPLVLFLIFWVVSKI